jgi:hypothetical protein
LSVTPQLKPNYTKVVLPRVFVVAVAAPNYICAFEVADDFRAKIVFF